MTRFFIRLMILWVVLFSGVLLLIHALPYDDYQARVLHDLLSPEGCPAPCFMGIRPGITTSKEAISLLKANAWIADVVPINTENPYQIWWIWSQNAPAFLRNTPTNPNFPVNGEVDSNGQYVSNIMFTPGATLTDIALIWGIPHESQLIFGGIIIAPDPSRHAITAFPYEVQGFWASGNTPCPYAHHIWDTPVRLRITDQFHEVSLGSVYPIRRLNFMGNIRQISQSMCGF